MSIDVHPRPSATAKDAILLCRTHWNAFADAKVVQELGSNQDRNFLIAAKSELFVLKIANAAWKKDALDAQDAALGHIAGKLEAPVPLPSRDGSTVVGAEIAGKKHFIRVVTYLRGSQLTHSSYLAPSVVANLGTLAAKSVQALADFSHPGLHVAPGQWDLRIGKSVVDSFLASINDLDLRESIAAWAAEASSIIEPLSEHLPVQPIHGDITDDNIVASPDSSGRLRPHGIIDFGDLALSYRVADLAVTCSSVLRHSDNPMDVLPAIKAFNSLVPLTGEEITAIWPLIVLRGCVLVASGAHVSKLDPDNESAVGAWESEKKIWRNAAKVPMAVAEEAIRVALGRDPSRKVLANRAAFNNLSISPLFPSYHGEFGSLDLSTTSDHLDSGRFLGGADAETRLLLECARRGSGAASTTWLEPRLTRTRFNSDKEPETVPLGVDVVVPSGTAVSSPFELHVIRNDGDGFVADMITGRLYLRGIDSPLRPGDSIPTASQIGTTGSEPIHIQLSLDQSLNPPSFTTPSLRAGWSALCPSPHSLLGLATKPPTQDSAMLLKQREDNFAKLQEHYYSNPPQIERGWYAHLFDMDGRAYLDMVNNVAAVGHSHPRLSAAIEKQIRKLNTNSRFHYAALAEFTEKLANLCPEGLDTVFLVNSGSEAVDLALHITQIVTGRMDVVAVKEAYHGWTYLSDAVTTSLYDNPRALETRPEWIHLAEAPNTFRGKYGGEGGKYAEDVVGLIARLGEEGKPAAAFICEPLFGNAGGIVLPDGYLAAAYRAVRGGGGLAIADEVQVGLGRCGSVFWAHQLSAVVPDIITIAKALGNGYPLGAVITTKSIAEKFGAQGNFFSSAGGSPVSCVVGGTVLDVIKDEELQENARIVGGRLKARCEALMDRYPLIGAVHGMGLYLGVELVKTRTTLDPATGECYAICERLLELGVICQPTGERSNVLKMKPPMCLTLADADFFVDKLEEVLRTGW